jgi:hypothetical protein
MSPCPVSSFLSINPLEPVLVFPDVNEAWEFRHSCNVARILDADQHPTWVYVPLPDGVVRVYTAKHGDVAYEFRSSNEAKAFNHAIKNVGTVFGDHSHRVYVGKWIKQ